MKRQTNLPIIGWREKIDFPGLKLLQIDAKIDTGADGSSIHYTRYKMIRQGGEKFLKFQLLSEDHPQWRSKFLKTKRFDRINVKSSSGHIQKRIQIRTKICFLGKTFYAYFSLSNRSTMEYPVLIGKNILRNRYIVDVSQEYCSSKPD